MPKRIHVMRAKPGQLRAGWGRPDPGEDPDICYAYGGGGAAKPDGRILAEALEGLTIYEGRSLREELDRRGYDITTLKFSIEQKSS
jgi:hypothetical protein